MKKKEFELKYDILLSIAETEARNDNKPRCLMFVHYAKEIELKYNLGKLGIEHKVKKYNSEVSKWL